MRVAPPLWMADLRRAEDASRFCFLEDVTSSMGYSGLACRFGVRVVASVTFSTHHIYYPRTNFIYYILTLHLSVEMRRHSSRVDQLPRFLLLLTTTVRVMTSQSNQQMAISRLFPDFTPTPDNSRSLARMSTSYHTSSQLAQPISPTAPQLALNFANPLSSSPNTTTLLSTALQRLIQPF